MAGNVVRGTCEERVKLLFRLLDRDMDKAIRASELRPFVSHMLETAAKIASSEGETNDSNNPSQEKIHILTKVCGY